MNKNQFVLSITFFLATIFLSSCKENCPPYSIGIKTGVIIRDSFFEHDTIGGTLLAKPIAPEGATFIWRIGTDKREFTQKELQLDFMPNYSGQTFELKLIVKFPGNDCYPERLDSVTKKFTFVYMNIDAKNTTYPIFPSSYLGKWRGSVSDNPNDVFDITIIDWGQDFSGSGFQGARVFNFPKGCSGSQTKLREGVCGDFTIDKLNWAPEIREGGYNSFYAPFTSSFSCCGGPFNMYGSVSKNNRNKILITLDYKDGNKKIFTGTRL